jgi:hypothetical protein
VLVALRTLTHAIDITSSVSDRYAIDVSSLNQYDT